jgi:BirA family biotin operon repressor/biotin-[acetyl-CoA-carboxylase] ligase
MAALDPAALRAALADGASEQLDRIEAFDEIDSTNTHLGKQPPPRRGRGHVAIAAHQTAGRGRHGNRWQSAPGKSLCLSMAYRFESAPSGLPALTLSQGVAVISALAALGARDLKLKWPNDILHGDAKLGGILTETQVRAADDVTVVTGVGVNLSPVEVDLSAGGWSGSVSSLDAATSDGPDQLRVAAAVIDSMIDAFVTFAQHGFAAFHEAYVRHDALLGRGIEIDTPDGNFVGTVNGIDPSGALLLDADSATTRVVTGSIQRLLEPARA